MNWEGQREADMRMDVTIEVEKEPSPLPRCLILILKPQIYTDWTTEQLDSKWLLVKNYVLSTPTPHPLSLVSTSLFIASSRITEAVVGGRNRRHCQEVPWYQPALQKVVQRTGEGRLEKGPVQPSETERTILLDMGSGPWRSVQRWVWKRI